MSRLRAALLAFTLPLLCACGASAHNSLSSIAGTSTSAAVEHIAGTVHVPDVPDPAPALTGTQQMREFLAAISDADIATTPPDLEAIGDYAPKMCMMKRLTTATSDEAEAHVVEDLSAMGIRIDPSHAKVFVSKADQYICPKASR